MRGGFVGNLILVLISVFLLSVIFGLFFGINVLDVMMGWLTLGLSAIIEFFAGIINAAV
jgi:hypothetical protein